MFILPSSLIMRVWTANYVKQLQGRHAVYTFTATATTPPTKVRFAILIVKMNRQAPRDPQNGHLAAEP